jgi:hypothetical protein
MDLRQGASAIRQVRPTCVSYVCVGARVVFIYIYICMLPESMHIHVLF